MLKAFKHLSIVAFMLLQTQAKDAIELNGGGVDTDLIYEIAVAKTPIKISKTSLKKVEKSFNTLIDAAKAGHAIYGLTTGVGLNKDRQIINQNLSKDLIDASIKFNKGLIYAHCGGVKGYLSEEIVRAIMAIRLNNMLFGGSGVSVDVVKMYEAFLNKNIIPLVPSFGSVGEADITILGHIGLSFMGEGKVLYKGKEILAKDALELEGLKPLEPFGKDALAIISSNAYSVAITSLAINELKHLNKMIKLVYAISLEGLNGNVAPFLEESANLRPFNDLTKLAKELREILKGSYLWDLDNNRALQDPLSFRDGVYLISTINSSLKTIEELLKIQLNSSDDNPGIVIKTNKKYTTYQENKYLTKNNGAVIPTANFEPIIWVLELEKAKLVLAHNSKASALRTIKLSDEYFTKLSRFLGTKNSVHAFGAMQKPFVALTAQNEALANPVSLNYMSIAGNIEDVATNAPLVAMQLREQINNLYYIIALELIHAAQAIDLRKAQNSNLKLSAKTAKLFEDFRKEVLFLDYDRPLSEDFEKAYRFVKNYKG